MTTGLLIIGGYLALIASLGWPGVLAALVHLASLVICAACSR